LTKPLSEVVGLVVKNYESLSSVKFQFSQEESQFEKLASLFDAETFMANVDEDLKAFTFEKLENTHKEFKEHTFKTFEEFMTENQNSFEAAKQAFSDYLLKYLGDAVSIEMRTFGNQLYNRFSQDKKDRLEEEEMKKQGLELVKPKEIKDIEFVKPQAKINELLNVVGGNLYSDFNDEPVYSQDEVKKLFDVLKAKIKELIHPIINYAGQIYKLIGDNQRISLELLQYCIHDIGLRVLNGETGAEFENVLKNAEERAQAAIYTLKRRSKNAAEMLGTAADLIKRDLYSFQYDHEAIGKSAEFREFALRIQEYLFKQGLDVFQPVTIHSVLRDALIKPLTLDANNISFIEFVKLIFYNTKFSADVSGEFNADLHTKLRIIDFVIFLPFDLFSQEMLTEIVNNYSKLANVGFDLRRFFTKTKLTLTSFHKYPTMSRSNVDFYVNYYRLLVEFVKAVNPELSENFQITNLFDQFIDKYFEEANDLWIQNNYLIVKCYNLFYVQTEFDFDTTFPEFTIDSRIGKSIMELANYKNEFSESLINAYVQVYPGAKQTSHLAQDSVEFMNKWTGKASLFNRVKLSSSQMTTVKKDLVLPKFNIKIKVVQDKLSASNNQKEYVKVPSENNQDLPQEKVLDTGVETQETKKVDPVQKIDEVVNKPIIQEEVLPEKRQEDLVPTRPVEIIPELVIGAHPREDEEELLNNKITPDPLVQGENDQPKNNIDPNLINPNLEYGAHEEFHRSNQVPLKDDVNVDEPSIHRSRTQDEIEEDLLEDEEGTSPNHSRTNDKIEDELLEEQPIHRDPTPNDKEVIEGPADENSRQKSPVKPDWKDKIKLLLGSEEYPNFKYNPDLIKQQNENVVIEMHNKLEPHELEFLKYHSVKEFIDNHQMVVTKGNTQIRYSFVVVTSNKSNCPPTGERRC